MLLLGVVAYEVLHRPLARPVEVKQAEVKQAEEKREIPPVTLVAKPPNLHFVWDVGGPDPSPQTVDLHPADIPLQGSVRDDWLAVTEEGRPGRLEVRVKPRDLHIGVGVYSAQVVVRAPGHAISNDPLFIPVRLEVRGVEEPKVPLRLSKALLTFTYTQNATVPDPLEIQAVQGDIGDASAGSKWLQATSKRKSVKIAVLPTLPPGEYDGYVSVTSADDRLPPVQVSVHLTVLAAAKPDLAKNEVAKTPTPTAPPPGCSDRAPVGSFSQQGSTTWRGALQPDQVLVIVGQNALQNGTITGAIAGDRIPDHQPLTIFEQDLGSADLQILDHPTKENHCMSLRIKNKGTAPVRTFQIHWQVVR